MNVAVGDWHQLGEYRFRETLHGPMHEVPCAGCGHPVMLVLPNRRPGEPLRDYPDEGICSGCGRRQHGAALPIRPNYPVVRINRNRLDPRSGGKVPMEGFFWRALRPDDPRVQCSVCGLPVDPAARTVEHPDTHPSCASYPMDAPMETPLPQENE